MSRLDPEALKRAGHQPCKLVDTVPSTNGADWLCPRCGNSYYSPSQAYCETCMESPESQAFRLEHLRDDLSGLKKQASQVKAEIAIMEGLVGDH